MLNMSLVARGAVAAVALTSAFLLCPTDGGLGTPSALAQSATPSAPTVLPARFPNTSDGKPVTQLGLYWWRPWNLEEPFIDITKQNSARWVAYRANGGDRMEFADLWQRGYIDKTTLYPKAIPPGYASIGGGRVRHGAYLIPSAYSGTYVLEWEGDADLAVNIQPCSVVLRINCFRKISATRLEATYDGASSLLTDWSITRIGSSGLKRVRIFRKENEMLLKTGRILDPRFAAHARQYKILRFMDVLDASQARPFHTGDFAKFAQATWSPEWETDYAKTPDAPKLASFEAIFRTSVETDTAAWVNVAGLPGAPALFNELAAQTSDPVRWREACRANLQTIISSPDWGAYMDEIVRNLSAAKYPTNRMVYLEPWNEVWNWGGPWARMTHCSDGVKDALTGSNYAGPGMPLRYGFGYLAAHAMVEFDKALTRAGRRQAWTLALASQMAWDQVTIGSLEGFRRYFADRGVDPKPWLRNVGVSTASYYNGVFSRTEGLIGAVSDAEHLQKWKSQILADPDGLARRRADWTIGNSNAAAIAGMIVQRKRHQSIAQSYGAYFLGDYEGESHELLPAYLASDPVVVNWAERFIAGSEGERLTRAWAEALRAQNPTAVISNYMSIWPRDPEGESLTDAKFTDPWFDGYYGDQSGRTRGLADILR
ncbi:MAG: hypothetical protein ABL957_07445 [Parvularculaceae bacterium]